MVDPFVDPRGRKNGEKWWLGNFRVPMLYFLNVGTVPMLYFLNVGTVPMLYFLNVGTVPMLYFLNVGTVPTSSNSHFILLFRE